MKYGVLLLTILLLFVTVFTGCGSGTTTTSQTTPATTTSGATTTPSATTPKYGGTLRVIYDSSPSGSVGYPIELIGDATFASQTVIERLILENNKGDFTPWLAESFTLSNDQTTMTLAIRKGIKFHDGSDLNA